MMSLLSALAGGLTFITVGLIIGSDFGFKRGVRIGRQLECDAVEARREARMRDMIRDLRAPVHPLHHPTFRAASFEDVIRGTE